MKMRFTPANQFIEFWCPVASLLALRIGGALRTRGGNQFDCGERLAVLLPFRNENIGARILGERLACLCL
jgi:hypothetical protein